MAEREHVITGRVRNVPGVLMQIGECFRKMQVNIQSLCAAPTEDDTYSYITIVTEGHHVALETIERELGRLLEAIEFRELGHGDIYERELLLVRVKMKPGETAHLMQVAEVFRAQVLGVGRDTLTFEFAGPPERVSAFLKALKAFSIEEVARTGRAAIKREEVS